MDANKFRKGARFVKKHDLRTSGPRVFIVAKVEEGAGFEENTVELYLVFTDGSRFSLRTQENLKRMIAAHGDETEKWVGKVVELYFSPDIPNPKGGDPGGIRLRVPEAAPKAERRYVSELEESPDPVPPKANGAEHADNDPLF